MTRATAPDRRRAFAVPDKPLPTFRVRSASGEPAHLVVLQHDGSLSCNCAAASFGARHCAHRRIAIRSIERRMGVRWIDGTWYGEPRATASQRAARDRVRAVLRVVQGGRGDDVDAVWEAVR